jgi:hypothetical protein
MRLSAYFSGSAREKVSKADNAFEFGITTILGLRDRYQVTFGSGHEVLVRGLTLAEPKGRERSRRPAPRRELTPMILLS